MSPGLLQTVKLWLVANVGLAKDALHVYVGLTVFLVAALLFRWPLRSWKPVLLVLAIALAGEVWDLRDSVVYRTRIDLWANWHDVWNTCFWPLAIMLLARRTTLFRRG